MRGLSSVAMPPEPGSSAEVELTVGDADTAVAMRSGDVPVLATPRVRAEATLMKVEGRRLTFNVSVNDARGLVAVGKITRVLVNLDRFMEKAP